MIIYQLNVTHRNELPECSLKFFSYTLKYFCLKDSLLATAFEYAPCMHLLFSIASNESFSTAAGQ